MPWTGNQYQLGFRGVNKGLSRDYHDSLTPVYPNKISYSALSALKFCPRQYWFTYPGSWQGWDDEAPALVRAAYWWKKVSGLYAWAGGLVHEFIEEYLYNKIDSVMSHLTLASPQSDRELLSALKLRFEGEWRQSRSWNWDSFRKAKKQKPIWLDIHVDRRCIDSYRIGESYDEAEQRLKKYFHDWVLGSARNFINNRQSYLSNSGLNNWLIIEGRRLSSGLIPTQGSSQSQLREASIYPDIKITLEGRQWSYMYTIDLMIFASDPRPRFFIIDFKTGKPKRWPSHRAQLQRYAAFLLEEGFCHDGVELTPTNMVLRAVYTKPWLKGSRIRDWSAHKDHHKRFLKIATEDILTLASRHVALESLDERQLEELGTVMPNHLFQGKNGFFNPITGKLNKETDPKTLVALPSDFPPSIALQKKWEMCIHCDFKLVCQEGRQLLSRVMERKSITWS